MALTLIFDANDTLWENNVVFERVREDFFGWLAHPDEAHARAVREEIETADVAVHGYGSAVFHARDRVAQLRGRPVTAAERAGIGELAAAFARHELELVPGVEEVLADLGTRHELRLMTKGDPVEQQTKFEVSGLAGHFRSVHVVARKDVATYRALASELALDPSTTWMIGNSPRSDAVFVPHPHSREHEEAAVDDSDVLTVGSLHDLPEHL